MGIELLKFVSFDALRFLASDAPFSDSDFINKIFPNGLWDLIIQLLAFLVMMGVVIFLGYKPVKKMVAKRREHIANELASAEEANRVAQQAAASADAIVEEGRATALRIVEEAKKEGETARFAIIAEAEKDAAERKKAADADIALAKEKSLQEVKGEIIGVALAASEAVLRREVSEKDNDALIVEFVEGLGEGK